jgi:hypothetical protein
MDAGSSVQPLKIFMNYRHEDTPFAAWTLYREFKGEFGKDNIFFDQGTLVSGMQFLGEIKSRLESAQGAFIAVIGPRWITTMLSRRQRGDEDYVVKEIDLALQNGWAIIPLLVDDASLPDPGILPQAIRGLESYQVARLRQVSIDDDVRNLSARLCEIRDSGNEEVGVSDYAVSETADNTGQVQVIATKAPISDLPPAGDDHYEMLVDEADNLVIFLGARANADDREGPFRPGCAMLPDDADLAACLAAKVRLKPEQRGLAGVAQYAKMVRGEPNVFKWAKEILGAESAPGAVHKSLARLPGRLEELGPEKRYQMIVTPKLDLALEQAFREAGEPFDVAVYMAPGTEYAGRFMHVAWGSAEAHPVLKPNEYTDFPFVTEYGELLRTVIVRINGAIDDIEAGYRWKSNLVITEDHYIDYLNGRPAEEVVPAQILAKLRQASCLFLGYSIADWPLRVFLRWIWSGESLGGATHWAVERDPDLLERQFWQRSGVHLYRSRLTDYVTGLDRFLDGRRGESA